MSTRLLSSPGVYRPQGDTRLLEEVLHRSGVPAGARVLDVGTGTGALAVAAARAGAGLVTAIDVSARAVLAARLNARLRGLPVEVRRAGSLEEFGARRFDLVVSNPPYVPSAAQSPPCRGAARAWDAGPDGRAVLDALCATAPGLLAPGGRVLLVQSDLSDVDTTVSWFAAAGLDVSIAARRAQPFGPVLRQRAGYLEARGLIAPGQRVEELVVIRGDRW
ncbi:methyltransferase [Saccharopolyspora sp. NFXS83]|uniref:HemK2/MTQ2 family protein methyltransferase n=1 Tax=Saccharopolyspora sp. NFXS83 TaxID=2993560 RepID=UPI00224ACFB7|nr:HemK2/MTQ2 family protein methyltransferase [Saccharopolyspora sp. NFXS83]MCX2729245.1 methyltransferase [Saccharopolyspora sp. NFXS83]